MSRSCLRFHRYSTSSTTPYTISTFKTDYPISLFQIRPDSYEAYSSSLEWWDSYLLIPIRKKLIGFTTTAWINMRFEDKDNVVPYMPDQFLDGAKQAVKNLFAKLYIRDQAGLESIMTPELCEAFRLHHDQIENTGLELELRLNSVSKFELGQTWMCFGDKRHAKSTLKKMPIKVDLGSLVFWRHGKDQSPWLYSELNFEYALGSSPKDLNSAPSFNLRTELTRSGAIVGIEVLFDVDLTCSITSPDKTQKWTETVRRQMMVRFESTYIERKSGGNWRVADIDNFFASKLFDESN